MRTEGKDENSSGNSMGVLRSYIILWSPEYVIFMNTFRWVGGSISGEAVYQGRMYIRGASVSGVPLYQGRIYIRGGCI